MTLRQPLFLLAAVGLVAVFGSTQQVVEEIVAIVNDDVITLSEFKREYDMRAESARAQLKGEELDKVLAQLKTGLLDQLITDTLLLQLARQKNLNVTDQVKAYLEGVKKQYNLETDDDLRRAVQSQNMDWDVFLKQIEENALRQSLIVSEVSRSIALDEAEVVDYYKKHESEFVEPPEYKARAIYLSTLEAGAEALDARKKDIDDKLKGGADFTETSGAASDAPLKDAKGDLGWLKPGETDKTLLDAVERLKKGETTAWIQAKSGWYLLKLEDKKETRLKPFGETRSAIEEKIFNQRQAVKFDEFLASVKKKSYIKILKPNPLGTDK